MGTAICGTDGLRSAVVPGGSGGRPGPQPGPADLSTLAWGLAREFRAPVGLLDPSSSPSWVARAGAPAETFPDPRVAAGVGPETAALGRSTLWESGLPSAPTWLTLGLAGPEGVGLVAWVGFASFNGSGPRAGWGPPCPEPALLAWGEQVARRLAAADFQGSRRQDRTLPERLARRLRVNDPPGRFQKLATAALREALEVEAVAWVPACVKEKVVLAGCVDGLNSEVWRALAGSVDSEPVRIQDHPVAAPGVRRVAVVAADVQAHAGWLLAANPREGHDLAEALDTIQPVASLIGVQHANAQLYVDLKDLLFGVIRALTSAIDAKDPYTSGHSERVARIATRLGEALSLPPHRLGDLYLMGLLHDVGKIGIEDGVLKKPGRLSPAEYRSIQAHVKIGVHILSDLKKLAHLLPGVAYHHEALDGSGYPSGLSGESIPLPARILAVADAFDAMSSSRPYRRRLPPHEIDAIFRKGSGVQWDARVVDALFACRGDLDRIRSKGLGESLQRAVGDALDRA